jgi:hypothetical protein
VCDKACRGDPEDARIISLVSEINDRRDRRIQMWFTGLYELKHSERKRRLREGRSLKDRRCCRLVIIVNHPATEADDSLSED